jgi:spermidine synthase
MRTGEPARRGLAARADRRGPPLEVLVFVAGASTLGSEIAAARLMAPYFGASTIVWANTIAIVLVALAVGYWVGGRLADRHPHMSGLCLMVLAAAVLLALVPIAADPFLGLSIEAFDSYSLGAFAGSLLGVLALVALPVLLLGAVSPWAIRLRLARVEDAGRMAGTVYAVSTAGSLLGTFLSALVLIPQVGTQRTFMVFAVPLALVAAIGLGRRWIVVPVVLSALIALPPDAVKARSGGRVVHETETRLQYARVVELGNGERRLELNEGRAVHSLYRPESVLTGSVWDGYLVAPFAGLSRAPGRIAILGTAGGTTARAYARYFPRTRIDAVEIDGELFELAERWFGLRDRPELSRYAEDARPFLRRTEARYDAIFLDAYRQPYIPFHLASREFFTLVGDRLRPGGVVVVNVGHPEGSDALERTLSATLAEVFEHQVRDPIAPASTLLIASRRPVGRRNLERAAATLPRELGLLATATARRIAPPLGGGDVYTDDRAPVEWLIDKSIVEHAARGRAAG